MHSDAPLGFGGAIERGMAACAHDWTFLLNNDMTLDADALTALLPRAATTCSRWGRRSSSATPTGGARRPGFTDWYADEPGIQLFHAPVRDDDGVGTHLCASGGAALFRTALAAPLRARERAATIRSTGRTSSGACARGATGCACCSVPRSRVRPPASRDHRALLRGAELDRIVERNRLLFDVRHAVTRTTASSG